MLTRYGTDNFLVMLGIAVVFVVAGIFVSAVWLSVLLILLGALLAAFTMWFFRDPKRDVIAEARTDESIVVSPADGKVVEVIRSVQEPEYMKSDAVQISIFLSPLNVHVNRSPVTGLVGFYKYIVGEYLVAYHPKSSELNERSLIGMENSFGKILFKQITGYVARRLVCELKVGDRLEVGQQFGMMKFGSRMDVLVPTNAEILVSVGQKVVGGHTILARLAPLTTEKNS